MEALWKARTGRVSDQVLHEFYHVATHRLAPPVPAAEARDEVRSYRVWHPLRLDQDLVDEAWGIEDRFGFSYWDSLIVAAARRSGCSFLLTEDLQDGQDLDGLSVLDPFSHLPEEIGLAAR